MRDAKKILLLLVGVMTVLLSSCSVSRHLPDDALLLDKVNVFSEEDPALAASLKSKVKQQPNSRFLGIIRLPLRVYSLAGVKDNAINRFLKNMGEAPRVYDEELAKASCGQLRRTLMNKGFLHAQVSSDTDTARHKLTVNYYVHPGPQYTVSSISYHIADSVMKAIVEKSAEKSVLKVDAPFDVEKLNAERSRLVALMHDNGYYSFEKGYVTYEADTARNSSDVHLGIRVRSGRAERTEDGKVVMHRLKPYVVDKVTYQLYPMEHTYADDLLFSDTLKRIEGEFLYQGEPALKFKTLYNASMLHPGSLYSPSNVNDTYALYRRLGALKYTNIGFEATSDSTLNCNIVSFPAKKQSVGFEVDLTHTSGDFGASAALAYTNRNLFKGSETFTFKVHGAYETMTQLTDYDQKRYFVEYGADMGLNFPRFIVPFVSNEVQRRSKATTQLDLQFNMQDRPEFVRNVASVSWGYLWNGDKQIRHRVDLLGLNLVSVPHKDPYFIKNYLDQYNSRNSILRFNYEDLLIFRTGYGFNYTSPNVEVVKDYFKVSHSVRANVESAGNLLYMLSDALHMRKDSLGQYRLFDIAFAQYVKGDASWTMDMNFNRRNSLLLHMEAGVAYPYGNTRMLPFEKRYYAGGANGVRGWNVRELGPGSYMGAENTIDYINHSGDIKLEMSLEYRMHLFWKFSGALFVDAGNIWTIYDYDDQPGGVFLWDKFYKQIAVAYGTGIRCNLNVVVLRADIAMKAINPAYLEGPLRYPVLHPRLRRDFAWHIAVGYPF